MPSRVHIAVFALLAGFVCADIGVSTAHAQLVPEPLDLESPSPLPAGLNPDEMLKPGGLSPTLKLMTLLTVLSLAPSLLMMTTCFVRFIIVFGLLRQAFGTQQLPPTQVLIALSLFLTALVMMPVWTEAYEQGVKPYSTANFANDADQQAGLAEAAKRSLAPMRQFMADQIEATGNGSTVDLFLNYRGVPADEYPQYYEDVDLSVLLPSYLLSELKTAFIIGFQIYLPFVVLDMVVASVLISMGMMMLPPPLISLPLKLLLFVLIDGWTLTVEMMLRSIVV